VPREGFPTNVTFQRLLNLPVISALDLDHNVQHLPIYRVVETASATAPDQQVMPDPHPQQVMQPPTAGVSDNIRENLFAFLYSYLKMGPQYTATHDGETIPHRVSLTIPGKLFFISSRISCLSNLCCLMKCINFFFSFKVWKS
jgi:hypothetical protein